MGVDSDGLGGSKVAVGQLGWQLLVEVGTGSWQLADGMLKLMLHTTTSRYIVVI